MARAKPVNTLGEYDAGERKFWLKILMRPFTEARITDRTERLVLMSLHFGRPVLTVDDLTRDELLRFRDEFYGDGHLSNTKFLIRMEELRNASQL